MTAIASRHDVTTRVWQHTRVIWYNPMTSQQYNGVASNFLIQQQHNSGLFGDDIVLLTFISTARLSSELPPFKMRRLLIAVGLLGPWTCSSSGKLMIRGVDTYSGLLSILFPVCGHLWPSEETEHITDHHHFIILTLWIQKNYNTNVCVLED